MALWHHVSGIRFSKET